MFFFIRLSLPLLCYDSLSLSPSLIPTSSFSLSLWRRDNTLISKCMWLSQRAADSLSIFCHRRDRSRTAPWVLCTAWPAHVAWCLAFSNLIFKSPPTCSLIELSLNDLDEKGSVRIMVTLTNLFTKPMMITWRFRAHRFLSSRCCTWYLIMHFIEYRLNKELHRLLVFSRFCCCCCCWGGVLFFAPLTLIRVSLLAAWTRH